MAQKPIFSQTPGQGRATFGARTELTQAFAKANPAKGGAQRSGGTTVVIQQPSSPASTDIAPAELDTLGLVKLSDAPDDGISVALTPNARVVQPFGPSGPNHAAGIVPDPGATAGATKFLNEDGTFKVPASNSPFAIIDSTGATVIASATAIKFLDGTIVPDGTTPTQGNYTAPSGGGGGVGGSGEMYTFTAPPTTGWSWVNQGSASIATTARGFFSIFAPPTGSDQLRIFKRSLIATPWTVTCAFLFAGTSANYQQGGIVLRDSATGKIVSLSVVQDSTILELDYWATTSNFAGQLFGGVRFITSGLTWLQISDDGTTRSYSLSSDGEVFVLIASESHTAFLTADEVGFYANANQNPHAFVTTLCSWNLTTP